MTIKTLDEILAELDNSSDSATALKNNKKDNNKKNSIKKSMPSITAEHLSSSTNSPTSTPSNNTAQSAEENSPQRKAKLAKTSAYRTQYKNRQYKKYRQHQSSIKKRGTKPPRPLTEQESDKKAVNYTEVSDLSIKALLEEVKREQSTERQHAKNMSAEQAESQDVSNAPDTVDSLEHLDSLDNLPDALKTYLKTPEQRQAEKDAIKADSRLRWLAFYYLSRREHSQAELKQKLLDKDQDPEKIAALLAEFAEKGYQSEQRTALMLIREGIRKGRGRRRIKQDFYGRQVDMPCNIDELIDMARQESDEFAEFIEQDEDDAAEKNHAGVDWLRLAVEAWVKKYGASIPSDVKEKAKQLRFLQYRGFQGDICFEALKHDLHSLDERY